MSYQLTFRSPGDLPPGLTAEALADAICKIVEWEDYGENAEDLALCIFNIYDNTGRSGQSLA